MAIDYTDPRAAPTAEQFEWYNLALSLGYKEFIGRDVYFYNQDYRSQDNMNHARAYAEKKNLKMEMII